MRMKLVSGHQQCCELLDGSIPLPPLTLDCIQLIMIVFNGDDDDADNDEDIIKKTKILMKFISFYVIKCTELISSLF